MEIAAKVAATGQLYGSVNAAKVAEALAEKGIEIDRKIITMHDVKMVGEYEAVAHFHKEVEVKIPVSVVAETAPEKAGAEKPAVAETETPAVAEAETPADGMADGNAMPESEAAPSGEAPAEA